MPVRQDDGPYASHATSHWGSGLSALRSSVPMACEKEVNYTTGFGKSLAGLP